MPREILPDNVSIPRNIIDVLLDVIDRGHRVEIKAVAQDVRVYYENQILKPKARGAVSRESA